jgi:hypothetical protein
VNGSGVPGAGGAGMNILWILTAFALALDAITAMVVATTAIVSPIRMIVPLLACIYIPSSIFCTGVPGQRTSFVKNYRPWWCKGKGLRAPHRLVPARPAADTSARTYTLPGHTRSPCGMEAAGELLYRSGGQMTRQLSTWLVLATFGGAVVAGCGGGGSSSTSSNQSGSTATTATSTPTTTAAASKPPSSTPSSIPTSPAALAEAVAVCKSIIERDPELSSATKVKVESICNKASHGDLAGARAAAKEVCTEVINASPIPAPAKAQALAACKRAS